MSLLSKLSNQRNALIGGALGGVGGGQLVVELADLAGIHFSTRQGALVAGAASTLLLFAARPIRYVLANGVRGAWHRILDGKAGAAPHNVDTAPGAATLTDAGEHEGEG